MTDASGLRIASTALASPSSGSDSTCGQAERIWNFSRVRPDEPPATATATTSPSMRSAIRCRRLLSEVMAAHSDPMLRRCASMTAMAGSREAESEVTVERMLPGTWADP
jgi:hypothetical protein